MDDKFKETKPRQHSVLNLDWIILNHTVYQVICNIGYTGI